jgi:hypothetical protein
MVLGDFPKLLISDYYVFDEEKDEYILLDGAPPDIVELFKMQKEIEEEEKRTGKNIF